jgi:hypothetical protein
MADNYLERQREQYEARKAAWLKSKKHAGAKKKGTSAQPLTNSLACRDDMYVVRHPDGPNKEVNPQ